MPKLADRMRDITVIRSLSTKISEHGRAADLISTGRPKGPALDDPEVGVVPAKELAAKDRYATGLRLALHHDGGPSAPGGCALVFWAGNDTPPHVANPRGHLQAFAVVGPRLDAAGHGGFQVWQLG